MGIAVLISQGVRSDSKFLDGDRVTLSHERDMERLCASKAETR